MQTVNLDYQITQRVENQYERDRIEKEKQIGQMQMVLQQLKF